MAARVPSGSATMGYALGRSLDMLPMMSTSGAGKTIISENVSRFWTMNVVFPTKICRGYAFMNCVGRSVMPVYICS